MCDYLENFGKKNANELLLVSRILIGTFLIWHGLKKPIVEIFTLMGFVGLVELLVGIAIIIGFATRTASGIGAIVMVGAVVWHFFVLEGASLNIFTNGSEKAFIYLGLLLVLIVTGAGKYALDVKSKKKGKKKK